MSRGSEHVDSLQIGPKPQGDHYGLYQNWTRAIFTDQIHKGRAAIRLRQDATSGLYMGRLRNTNRLKDLCGLKCRPGLHRLTGRIQRDPHLLADGGPTGRNIRIVRPRGTPGERR
ncbi:hypothetical protein Sulac_0633 [Sulfobacillus acidophilus DSM 10332]|uniref:Uncharacterized protein n=1 Tax=Sulfobacillus acidophilus (strain ATCC 700253 / DSM 10332 / NAL) TaxID=679936 RepID=G8TZY1_SULAD|nr:hypothetical protein Sulac_0633 [Sulfobacillus acidophilus DSM 10332]